MSRGESSSHPEDVRTAMLHLDEDVLRRIHALADKKNKDPMMLARDFIIERLYEEEKSEGILASPTSVPDPSPVLELMNAVTGWSSLPLTK